MATRTNNLRELADDWIESPEAMFEELRSVMLQCTQWGWLLLRVSLARDSKAVEKTKEQGWDLVDLLAEYKDAIRVCELKGTRLFDYSVIGEYIETVKPVLTDGECPYVAANAATGVQRELEVYEASLVVDQAARKTERVTVKEAVAHIESAIAAGTRSPGSQRGLAQVLGCSSSTINKAVKSNPEFKDWILGSRSVSTSDLVATPVPEHCDAEILPDDEIPRILAKAESDLPDSQKRTFQEELSCMTIDEKRDLCRALQEHY